MSEDTYVRERTSLVEMEQKSADQHDKSILTMTAGALGLSLTFIDKIAPNPAADTLWIIGAAWLAFIVSIVVILASFLTSQSACRKQRDLLDLEYSTGERPEEVNRFADFTRSWLVGLKPVEEKEEEQAVVEKGLVEAEKHVSHDDSSVSWIRFRGNSRFRREAKEGDVVVCIWTGDGKSTPDAVYHHAPILLRKNDKDNDVTWIYIEEYPDADQTTLTWKQFQKLYSQIGMPGTLSQWAVRELTRHHSDALHDLWFDQK